MSEVRREILKASESGDPDLYPSQSTNARSGQELSVQRDREEPKRDRPRMESVVSKAATVRRKSKFQQTLEDMGHYLWNDILKPALQATAEDLVGNGVHYAIYGEAQGRRGKDRRGSRLSFSDEYERERRRGRDRDRERERRETSYEDIAYDTKDDAMRAIYKMKERADRYPYATVLDLFDVSGRTGNVWTDDEIGWTYEDLSRATIQSYYDRYDRCTKWYINLPRPVKVD